MAFDISGISGVSPTQATGYLKPSACVGTDSSVIAETLAGGQ